MNEKGPAISGDTGWYSTPSGEQRYWDGEKWLDLPPPRSEGTGAPQRRGWVLAAVLIVVVVGLVGGLLLLKSVRDEREATQQLMSELQEQRQAEQEEQAEIEQQEQDEADRQQENEKREIEGRKRAVEEVESNVAEMAEEHIADGLIEGEVLSVNCTPVAGASVEDLMDKTTVLECFVATEDLGGGRARGFDYNATMNWDTGEYTYSFGKP